ncbi:hypothetical protein KDA_29460 [Dictyobacter alpinus]|uniref:Uncharacterized protein n=1 Tax=Dictyobacter alpinus TaxID=2014873 RepID=A0A402B821_9CHLR|nr:hypothetical protein [Dictyobacter alpinus]GCE27462.1 hypothetical protein KDA_29460 [Dictyobacter alpinus]
MRGKKQIGMYSISVDEEGALQIQAPTLLRPLQLDPQQAQELHSWLSGLYGGNTTPTPVAAPEAVPAPVEVAPAPVEAPVDPPVTSAPAPQQPAGTPQEVAQRAIRESIATAHAQYPASLAPENRDRFIEQVTRHPAIKPLMSQGKVSFKQVMLWVEQNIESEK